MRLLFWGGMSALFVAASGIYLAADYNHRLHDHPLPRVFEPVRPPVEPLPMHRVANQPTDVGMEESEAPASVCTEPACVREVIDVASLSACEGRPEDVRIEVDETSPKCGCCAKPACPAPCVVTGPIAVHELASPAPACEEACLCVEKTCCKSSPVCCAGASTCMLGSFHGFALAFAQLAATWMMPPVVCEPMPSMADRLTGKKMLFTPGGEEEAEEMPMPRPVKTATPRAEPIPPPRIDTMEFRPSDGPKMKAEPY